MTLEWVMHEIREAEAQPNSAKAVYDLAALLIVRNYLSGGKPDVYKKQEDWNADNVSYMDDYNRSAGAMDMRPQQMHGRQIVFQTDEKPRTDVIPAPTLEDVEEALKKINISTREDRQKAQELKEITRIMQGK